MSDASGGDVSGAADAGSTTPAEVTAAPVVSEISEAVSATEVVPEVAAEPVSEVETEPVQTSVAETVVAVPMPAPAAAEPAIKSFLSRALDALQIGKRAKLDKILAEAKRKHSITNDGVEKLLRVSDATATRYLSQLVKEGKLRRVGAQKRPTYEPA